MRSGELVLPATEPFVLQALPSGELEVLVRTVDGTTAAERSVYARTWLGSGPPSADAEARAAGGVEVRGRTDAAGRALLRGVAAGTVEVRIFKGFGMFSGTPAGTPPPQSLELAPGGRATVVFDEPPL